MAVATVSTASLSSFSITQKFVVVQITSCASSRFKWCRGRCKVMVGCCGERAGGLFDAPYEPPGALRQPLGALPHRPDRSTRSG